MTYTEIKQILNNLYKECSSLKQDIGLKEQERKSKESEINSAENTYQLQLRQEKDSALQQKLNDSLVQYTTQISSLETQIASTEEKFQQELEKLSNTDIQSSYSNEAAMTTEIYTLMAVIQEQLSKSISSRFQQELEAQIDTTKAEIEIDDVTNIINFFNEQSEKLEHLSTGNKLENFMDKILKFVRVPEINISNKKEISYGFLLVLLVIMAILASKVVFPAYAVFLVLLCVYNIRRNYIILGTIIAQKSVKDNLRLIEDSLKEKAMKFFEQKKSDIEARYKRELDALKGQLNDAQIAKESQRNAVSNSFSFDDTAIRDKHNKVLQINKAMLASIENDIAAKQAVLKEKQEEIVKYNNLLQEVAGDIQKEYLNFEQVGNSFILDFKFIIDIKSQKPVTFAFPERNGVLFLYKNNEDVSNFIRLILIQLRIKMSPHSFNCTTIDTVTLGKDVLAFKPDNPKKDEAVEKMFSILYKDDDISDYIQTLSDELAKRIMTIRQTCDSINEYNRNMLTTESLPESYEFIFFRDPKKNVLSNDIFTQIFENGTELGLIMSLFIEKESFYKMGESAFNCTRCAGAIYELNEGSIFKRSQEYVIENYIKSNE